MLTSAELFDTHAHLTDEQFDDPYAVVERASAAGVTRIVSVATDFASTQACIALADRFPQVYASAGIHPNHTHEALPGHWEQVCELAAGPTVVAIGETGLDKHWDFAPFALQQDYFDRHLRLSQRLAKPFIVHVRDCAEDVLLMLREARQRGVLTGVLHSFTGDAAMAEECVGLGLCISFAGMITFKKSNDLRSVATRVPLQRLLIETDAPYLSPHPFRGSRPNEPARVIHTAQCLADLLGTTLEEIACQTTANARRLFGV